MNLDDLKYRLEYAKKRSRQNPAEFLVGVVTSSAGAAHKR
jgi:hypothetical protein